MSKVKIIWIWPPVKILVLFFSLLGLIFFPILASQLSMVGNQSLRFIPKIVLPVMAMADEKESPGQFTVTPVIKAGLNILVGVQLEDPLTYLKAEIPMMDVTPVTVDNFDKSGPNDSVSNMIYKAVDPPVKNKTKSEKSSIVLYNTSPVIVIDPGHGGGDPGVIIGQVAEKNINLEIAKILKNYLVKKDYKVILTRTIDVSLNKLSKLTGTSEERDLDARVALINHSDARLFISIHVNSLVDHPEFNGSIVYYNDKVPGSKSLACYIQEELNNLTVNGKKREPHNVRSSDFYILINSRIPGVLVETGFISNPAEQKLLTQTGFRKKIAGAIAYGVKKYLRNM